MSQLKTDIWDFIRGLCALAWVIHIGMTAFMSNWIFMIAGAIIFPIGIANGLFWLCLMLIGAWSRLFN